MHYQNTLQLTETSKNSIHTNQPLLFEVADGYLYSNPVTSLETTSRLYFPVETDTEYYHPNYDINKPSRTITKCLTVQHRAIEIDLGMIFSHQDSADFARHPLLTTGFSPVDYLNALGVNATIERTRNVKNLPIFQFDIYGFFLVAELYRMVSGEFCEDINKLVTGTRDDNASIEMGRRLIASTILKGNRAESFVYVPWVLTLEGQRFQVAISLFDTCAVHGVENYAGFCTNSGLKLTYKDNFSIDEKACMQVQYKNKPEDFDNYALGDLYNHKALVGNMSNFGLIYKSLDIQDYFEPPRLTIGATVARILRSSMLKHLGLGIEDKNRVIELCRYGTSKQLKTMKRTTAVYNAKVDGGRCRNNRPVDVSVHRPLADVDIAGCYGNGLKHQSFPFGRPFILDYPINSKQNVYLTLKQFLKKYRKELVAGLWQARVSTPEGYTLKYPQDFLISWIPPKDPSKIPTDSDLQEMDWYSEDNIGLIKLFTHEVKLALINEEFLDWLDNTASKRQRAELLNNLQVVTAAFYPASERCDNVIEFFEAIENHKGENLCFGDIKPKKSKKISIEQECHSWISVNLGELLVTSLLEVRAKYDKNNPEEKPLNTLYKLCINTIYGDMVSPFFDISNAIVGNNITARARAMAWYMEKGLHGFQTITDGCAFELNQVVYQRTTKLTSETVMIEGYNPKPNYILKPIDGFERIEVTEGEKGLGLTLMSEDKVVQMDNAQAKDWLALAVKQHLKACFPGIPVIDKFNFEIKDIYDAGAFHGTANYKFRKVTKTEQGKMRSYSKKHRYNAYTLTGDELQLFSQEYKPSEDFLSQVLTNPQDVERSQPYIATKILKTAEYKNHYDSRWQYSEAFPGCTIENGRLLRECSLTQFTFLTHKQYLSWERESKRLRDMLGQTYESWFLTDGTLDFKAMCVRLNHLIRSGAMRFSESRLSSQQRHLAREYEQHPGYPALVKIKEQLAIRYGFVNDSGEFECVLEIDEPGLEDE